MSDYLAGTGGTSDHDRLAKVSTSGSAGLDPQDGLPRTGSGFPERGPHGSLLGDPPHPPERRGSGAGAVVNAVIGAMVLVLVAVGVVVFLKARDDDKEAAGGFTPEEFFGANGSRSIQDSTYEQLATDTLDCTAGAEPGLAPLLDESGCTGVIRAVSVDAGRRFVGTASVVRVADEARAEQLEADINAGRAGTDRVPFLLPPPGTGATYRPDPANLTIALATDRYLVVVEVARFDGSAAETGDEQAGTTARDLAFVPVDHILAEMLRA
ncbi:hypothetical protein [Yinghuangia sp. YIM S09857]|uniref:hypothetical protein n=1 Tax=Yinghuangia sp. YIM S09857 TaxID=3436929 RepID=UPI003F52CCE1